MQNYYDMLGLPSTATAEEIRRAYLQLARECHPDLHPEDVAAYTRRFQAINEAYQNLHDPVSRERFERRWAHFQSPPPPSATVPAKTVRWEGPGAKYRKSRGGRSRYFSKPGGFFGMR
jgi:curved DNA-binding protein CbpA